MVVLVGVHNTVLKCCTTTSVAVLMIHLDCTVKDNACTAGGSNMYHCYIHRTPFLKKTASYKEVMLHFCKTFKLKFWQR